jgi:hypothetical protein
VFKDSMNNRGMKQHCFLHELPSTQFCGSSATRAETPNSREPLYFETPTARSRGSVQCLWYLFRYEPLLGTTLPPLSRNFPVIRCNEGRSCTTPQCDTVVTILQGLSGSVGHSLSGVGSTLFGLMALRMHRPDPQVTTTASLTCSSSRSVTLLPGLPR